MKLFNKTFILLAFVIPVLTACGSDGSNAATTTPPVKATFDSATFDKSTWE